MATGGLAAAGFAAPASASSALTPYDDDYRTVIDIADAGADLDGDASITPVLKDLRADDTLFYFPPGRYHMDDEFRFTGFENFGVYGDDATLVPADFHDWASDRQRLFRLGVSYAPGGRVRFENLYVDQTAPDTGVRVIDTYASERLDVRRIEIHGEHDSGFFPGPGHFNITDSDGVGRIEYFRAPDGGAWESDTPNAGNIWVGPIGIAANHNKGTLEFFRCWLGGFPNNGLYANDPDGTYRILGGLFQNSNVANLRIGGRNSEIRYPTIQIDSTRPRDGAQRGIRIEECSNMLIRGARIKNTSPQPNSRAIAVMPSVESATIENSTIEMRGDDSNHGIVVSGGTGEVLVQHTDIDHSVAGGFAVWVRPTDVDDRVHLRGVSITGEAGRSSSGQDAVRISRDNCRISGSTIKQRGRNGDTRIGVFATAEDLTIYRCEIRAEVTPYYDRGIENLIRNSDLESYRDGVEGVTLHEDAVTPKLYVNRIVNGIKDRGATDVRTWRNTYE